MERFQTESLSLLRGDAATLAHRIQHHQAHIGIVGLGYVGMPILLEFAKKGYQAIGVDISTRKVEALNQGQNFIEDLDDAEVRDMVAQGRIRATTDFAQLHAADIIYIAVPTPFNDNKEPDISYIISAGQGVATALRPGQLIILKSTTFPGTTEEHLIPVLNQNASGLVAGQDYFVAFSPERVDPGNKFFHTANTPIVVGGTDPASTILTAYANAQIIEQVYMVSSPKVAEMEKLLENIFRGVNIALVNELALLCERMGGINVWEVIEAAGTKPFGYMKFLPGPGVGGHCIPIDPYYLSWLARAFDFETKFITLAANVNESMSYHVANLVVKEVAKQPVALADARVLVLGASFKKNVRDLRHSPSEALIIRLLEHGFTSIDVSDPWAPEYHAAGRVFDSVALTPESLQAYHCAVLVTDHDAFDIGFIVQHSRVLIDTRNMTQRLGPQPQNVVLLGYTPPFERIRSEH